jgi:hypothetical protein
MTMPELLEQALEAVRRLPPGTQDEIARAMLGLAASDGEAEEIDAAHPLDPSSVEQRHFMPIYNAGQSAIGILCREDVKVSNSKEAKARAEASLKRKQDRAREGAKAWAEYEAQHRGVDEKIARLRSLRLAKEAAEAAAEGNDAQQARTKKLRRPAGSGRKIDDSCSGPRA